MAKLTESSNAGEVKEFLLSRMDSFEDDDQSRVNPSLTKLQAWNIFFGVVFQKQDSESVHYLALQNIIKEFGSYYEKEAV